MSEVKTTVSKSWLALSCLLIVLEVFFIYEAMLADIDGLERVFGVLTGLALLCFGVLLYVVTSVVYT
ncbi:MAG: hypothetical protein ABSF09_07250 [Candidatus Bathyarchaeia archaeon]